MDNVIELLNKIRSEASATYQDRIPEATQENMESIRYAMIGDDNVQVANEFMDSLLNKLVKSVIHAKKFENPLKPLKQGKKPVGDGVEEIYTNFIKADDTGAFDGTKLLERKLPDTKTIYHRMNLELQYPVTINRTQLSKAFASYDALDSYINDIINKLYSSAEFDEFMNMKQLFASAVEKKAIKVETVANPYVSEANAKAFIKHVKNISSLMKYPSESFNSYLTAQNVDTTPVRTLSRLNEQILIIPEAVNNTLDVDVLASSFNMSLADFNKTRKVLVDELPVANCLGALVDEKFLQVWDDYYIVTDFKNGKGLYNNYYLNIGQTMAYSPLVNAVLFVYDDATGSEEE